MVNFFDEYLKCGEEESTLYLLVCERRQQSQAASRYRPDDPHEACAESVGSGCL